MYGGKNEIIYPVFLDCIKYTDDIFWQNILEELSYGRCPYGIYINNNYICCNYKDKKFSYNIISNMNDSQKLYTDVYNILKYTFGLLSKKDKLLHNNLFLKKQNDMDVMLNQPWCNIKKNNIKILLLEKFIIQKSNHYNLTLSQQKRLYNDIILGLLFKTINKSHIIYNNLEIKEIKHLSFKQGDYKFNTDIYNFKNELIFV